MPAPPPPRTSGLIVGEARGAGALSVARRVLPRAVPDRAQDQPVADGDRAAALCAGARSRGRLAGHQGLRRRRCRSTTTRRLASDDLYLFSYLRASTSRRCRPRSCCCAAFRIAYAMARAPRRLQPVLLMLDRAAVLDVVPHPRLCLDQHPAARRPAQPGALTRCAHRSAAHLARDRHRDLYRHRLFVPAVHGAAALCERSRRSTTACSRPPPISAARAGRRSGRSRCRCRCPASAPARCSASSRSSASSSSPICSAAPTPPMIGQTLWTEFFSNKDWPVASAIAVVLLCCWSARSWSISTCRRAGSRDG